MPIPQTRIEYLLQKYAANTCTKKELLELFKWIELHNDDTELRNAMQVVWQGVGGTDAAPGIDKEKVFSHILSQASSGTTTAAWRIGWGKKVAAAAILVVVASSIYFFSTSKIEKPVTAAIPYKGDVAPGRNGAVLTLSNGQKIVLDSAGNGQLVKEGGVAIVKEGNEITYRGKTDDTIYNTVSTDKGHQWQLRLPDGTKVWLNAASSISYPLNFDGKERNVEVMGEAYFEVAHDAKRVFKVHIKTASGTGSTIEDIGTSFNVNAYTDEPAIKTTLVEGMVKLSVDGSKGVLLKPRQQAIISNQNAATKIWDDIDTDEATAWKDGLFKFNEGNVEMIMRQIGRWYNVRIVYEGGVPNKQIHGTASRNTNLSSILKVLSLSGVNVQMEENRIIIKP